MILNEQFRSVSLLGASLLCSAMFIANQALAQNSVPAPDPEFQGEIGKTYKESKADPSLFAPRSAPDGAPNIVLVLIDDAGYGASHTFGGPSYTPTLQKLAETGLRYTRFHTTAVCSPTRAALLNSLT